ncbi:ABC transporter substrate-binding protein [Haloquadratum walsbyi]|jgi:ABC-type branched-subunit amino acid transport system substrate-binding protein|uniref:ABC transporter substrate-binding protein n=1 Tax=Haloquadratum walsbyi TaxID=293091 RepID=UPI0015F3A620|nr:ABC transporter substrate-binding protein [Haloquadratum walsbyi]
MPSEGADKKQRIANRRTYLKGLGAAGTVLLAGCSGSGGGSGGDDAASETESGSGDGDSEATDGGTMGGDDGTLTIGALQPFTGGFDWIASNTKPAYNLAFSEIEEAGILGGMSLEANEQDSATDPQQALSGLQTLDSAGVPAVIGPSSSVMPNLIQPIQNNEVPVNTVMAGTIQLDDTGGEWLWRSVPSDAVGGAAAGKYAYEDLNHEKMALAYKNDKGSQSFSASVGEAFKSLGGSIVGEVPLPINASDYRSEIQELQQMDVDFVQMTAATEVSGLFMKNYDELGAGEDFNLALGNDVLTQSFIETTGADVMEGMIGQAPAAGPANDQFAASFEEMHGEPPGTFSAAAYDAANLFALAFQSAGEVSRSVIPEHLPKIATPPGTEVTTFAEGKEALDNGDEINYTGASNPQNFDENGNVVGPFNVVQAQDGEWNPVTTYEASVLQDVY